VAFTTKGIDPDPWLARGGAGLAYQVDSNVKLSVRYDAEYRQNFLNQTASLEARWAF
jgi:autotransporter family porin